ncbi:MAG: glycoside hydrolase family 5 protein [Lachnospiraceae bacterium]|nr:glycoside hydrolase family 5 protein [Lachnospiraceae bacterium]
MAFEESRGFDGQNQFDNQQQFMQSQDFSQQYVEGMPMNDGMQFNDGMPVNDVMPYVEGMPVNNGMPYAEGMPIDGGMPYAEGTYTYDEQGNMITVNPEELQQVIEEPQVKKKTFVIVTAVLVLIIALLGGFLTWKIITGKNNSTGDGSDKRMAKSVMKGDNNNGEEEVVEDEEAEETAEPEEEETEEEEVTEEEQKDAEDANDNSSTAATQGTEKDSAASSGAKKSGSKFVHVSGRKLLDANGNNYQIKGMGFGNDVWANPKKPVYTYNDENSYKELASYGFNSVRYYLNYRLFEDDDKPYTYKDEGFAWLDKNIEWAGKYGIKLVLNMHVPQGGFMDGDSANLWNESNMDRCLKLWEAIAKRYANNENVLGYGLLNEPYLPKTSDDGKKELDTYYNYINKLVKTIRAVDSNHMFFVERPYGTVINSSYSVYPWGTTDSYRIINDTNTVYEFHYYYPIDFTYQGLSWHSFSAKITYNDPNVLFVNSEGKKKTCYTNGDKSVSSADSDWKTYESGVISITGSDMNYGYWAINANELGSDGVLYIDDITVDKVDQSGNKIKTVNKYTFDSTVACTGWDQNTGGGKWSYDATQQCMAISGVGQKYIMYPLNSTYRNFALKKGEFYKISARYKVKTSSSTAKFNIGVQSAYSDSVYGLNKDYLRSKLVDFINWGKSNNVPLYMGEVSTTSYVMNPTDNGTGWITDMLDLINEYGIGFSYHDYHNENFGFYRSNMYVAYSNKNTDLEKIFKAKLK